MPSVEVLSARARRAAYAVDADGHVIVVPHPSPDDLLASGNSDGVWATIFTLAGDQASAVRKAVAADDHAVAAQIAKDMRAVFGATHARRLTSALERYAPSVRYDLQSIGVDLDGVFTGVLLPDQVMDLVDRLPRHSHFASDLAQDDELADIFAQETDEDSAVVDHKPRIPVTEFTPEVAALTAVAERLNVIAETVTAVAGAKTRMPDLAYPHTAEDRRKERAVDAQIDELISDIQAAHEQWLVDHPEEI